MTSLTRIIQKIGFKEKFDFQQSDVYQKHLKQKAKFIEFKHNASLLLCFLAFPLLMILNQIFGNSPFLWVPLIPAFISIVITVLPYSFFYKKETKFFALPDQNFKQKLAYYLATPSHRAELFQAFEQEIVIQNNFNLTSKFFNIEKMIDDNRSKPNKKLNQNLVDAIEPLLEHFMNYEKNKNTEGSDAFKERQNIERYRSILNHHAEDELMFSAHPPLRARAKAT